MIRSRSSIFFSSRRRHTRLQGDWSSDVCSSDLTAQPGLDVLIVDRKLPDADPASLAPAPTPPSSPDAAPVRWAFYTSGTTADPKGAQHTDRTIMASAYGMTKALAIEPGDVSALVFPFTHIGGIGGVFSPMLVGVQTIAIQALVPATTIPVLQREGVPLAGAGPPVRA